MSNSRQEFGGGWTAEKLERVQKYLEAYKQALKNQPFHLTYIDAFAGTGYNTPKKKSPIQSLALPGFAEEETRSFIDGSARIALQEEPPFDKYIFIELEAARIAELQKLRREFSSRHIEVVQSDANSYIKSMCEKSWGMERAVLFLDPFGMQVTWDTIEAIASTKAIDLWLLFPLGVAVNRLLKKNGQINETWRRKLDAIFGEPKWFEAFYQTTPVQGLFGDELIIQKTGNFASISQYFVNRLKTVFTGVAENPLPLMSSRNNPLYLLCFAASNPKGAPIALRIARHILRK